MRKIKTLLKIMLIGIATLVVLTTAYTVFVFSDWNPNIDHEKLDVLLVNIENTRPQDDGVVAMYGRIHQGALERSIPRHVWQVAWGKRSECPCVDAVRLARINKTNVLKENEYAVAMKVARRFLQRDCLHFVLANYKFGYGTTGPEEAARFYYERPVAELSEEERIGLVVLMENAALYDPKRFPERYARRVEGLREGLER